MATTVSGLLWFLSEVTLRIPANTHRQVFTQVVACATHSTLHLAFFLLTSGLVNPLDEDVKNSFLLLHGLIALPGDATCMSPGGMLRRWSSYLVHIYCPFQGSVLCPFLVSSVYPQSGSSSELWAAGGSLEVCSRRRRVCSMDTQTPTDSYASRHVSPS